MKILQLKVYVIFPYHLWWHVGWILICTYSLSRKLIDICRSNSRCSQWANRNCFNAQCAGAAVRWDVDAMFARETAGRIRWAGIIMSWQSLYRVCTLFPRKHSANECLEDVTCVLNMVNSNLNTFCSCRTTLCKWLALNKVDSFYFGKETFRTRCRPNTQLRSDVILRVISSTWVT